MLELSLLAAGKSGNVYGTACLNPFTHSMQLTHEKTAIDIDGFAGHKIVFDKKLYCLCEVKGVTIFMEGVFWQKIANCSGVATLSWNRVRITPGATALTRIFGAKGCVAVKNDLPNSAQLSTVEGAFSEKPLYFFL